ncbi:MAG: mechanosensitive ion channel family protein, partial [Oligoflexia bacterium]|nr:mechanosensitive ion channel family protein [Oligoflexia bacterium]
RNEIDDIIVDVTPTPLAISVLLMGCWYAVQPLGWSDAVLKGFSAVMMTVAVALWTRAASRVSKEFLGYLATHQDRFAMVEPRTLPLFDITARTLLFGGAAYFLLLAWDIDVTAWLASAGVVGVAVGFASKDTLSNLFAGLFIVADAPYKLGDFLVVDETTRGRVTQIGLRSTRLLTRDDVEIIVPNSVMAGGRITNASGGPSQYERVHCAVDVGYGSDLDQVRQVLLDMAKGLPELLQDVEGACPQVSFQGFMDSGIRVEVRGWVALPEQRGRAVDAMVVGIWRALRDAKIEIPFPQREVRLLSPAPPAKAIHDQDE